MNNEILDEEINDNNQSAGLNSGNIISSILLSITGYSLLSEAYNYYRLITNINDILTLIPPEDEIIFTALMGILCLLGGIGILTKSKRAYLFLVFAISLMITYCFLKIWYGYPYEYIDETVRQVAFYLILIGILSIFLRGKKDTIKHDMVFYIIMLLAIILGKLPFLFGEFTITKINSILSSF